MLLRASCCILRKMRKLHIQSARFPQHMREIRLFFCQCAIYAQDILLWPMSKFVQDLLLLSMRKILLLLSMRKILLLLSMRKILLLLSDFTFLSAQCKLWCSKNERSRSSNSIDFSLRLPSLLTSITSLLRFFKNIYPSKDYDEKVKTPEETDALFWQIHKIDGIFGKLCETL